MSYVRSAIVAVFASLSLLACDDKQSTQVSDAAVSDVVVVDVLVCDVVDATVTDAGVKPIVDAAVVTDR